jgi:hypothetical protein
MFPSRNSGTRSIRNSQRKIGSTVLLGNVENGSSLRTFIQKLARSMASVANARQKPVVYAMANGMGVRNVQKMRKRTNSWRPRKRLDGSDATAVGR